MAIDPAATITDERALYAARQIARAENRLGEGSSREQMDKAHRHLGSAVTASLRGDRIAVAEAANAAVMWAEAALVRNGYDRPFAKELMADDPAQARADQAAFEAAMQSGEWA